MKTWPFWFCTTFLSAVASLFSWVRNPTCAYCAANRPSGTQLKHVVPIWKGKVLEEHVTALTNAKDLIKDAAQRVASFITFFKLEDKRTGNHRKELRSNIILSGGVTKNFGWCKAFKKELQAQRKKSFTIYKSPKADRDLDAIKGGCHMANTAYYMETTRPLPRRRRLLIL